MKVEIPITPAHGGFDFNVRQVEISDKCPVCGGQRGKPFRTKSYDGSRWVSCDGWLNSCGHTDKYEAVMQEAIALKKEAQK